MYIYKNLTLTLTLTLTNIANHRLLIQMLMIRNNIEQNKIQFFHYIP